MHLRGDSGKVGIVTTSFIKRLDQTRHQSVRVVVGSWRSVVVKLKKLTRGGAVNGVFPKTPVRLVRLA
jgi:hypothetical protein